MNGTRGEPRVMGKTSGSGAMCVDFRADVEGLGRFPTKKPKCAGTNVKPPPRSKFGVVERKLPAPPAMEQGLDGTKTQIIGAQ
jgi:hypothetical protein